MHMAAIGDFHQAPSLGVSEIAFQDNVPRRLVDNVLDKTDK